MAYDAQSRDRAQAIGVLFCSVMFSMPVDISCLALPLVYRTIPPYPYVTADYLPHAALCLYDCCPSRVLDLSFHAPFIPPIQKSPAKAGLFRQTKACQNIAHRYDIGHTSVRAARCLKAHGLRRIARTACYDKPTIASMVIVLP